MKTSTSKKRTNWLKWMALVILIFIILIPILNFCFGIPRVKYGEFPFELIYEKDGKQFVVSDTLCIRYEGIAWDEASGFYYKLSPSYKKGNMDHTTGQAEALTIFRGTINNESHIVYLELGDCEYYMGMEYESQFYRKFNISPGDIVVSSRNYNGAISAEELADIYNIKLISFKISPPIAQNTITSKFDDD